MGGGRGGIFACAARRGSLTSRGVSSLPLPRVAMRLAAVKAYDVATCGMGATLPHTL